MSRAAFRAASFVLLGVLGTWAAGCVGDDPTVGAFDPADGGPGGPDGGGGADARSSCRGDEPAACGPSCTRCPEPSTGGKATCTAGACGVECAAPAVACGAQCAVLAASAEHCGACGHSCGGGVCLASTCQPVAVVQGLVGPVAFAVATSAVVISMTNILGACDLPAGCGAAPPKELAKGYKSMGPVAVTNDEVFWSAGSQGDSDAIFLRRCALAGCPPAAVQVDHDFNGTIDRVDVRATSLVWRRVSGGGQIRSCTLPGCDTKLTVIAEPNLLALVTDGTSLFFSRGAPAQVFKCAANVACVAPPVHTTGRVSGPAIRELGGVLYGVDTGLAAGINDGYVWSAPAGAAGGTTAFAREEIGPTDLAVDAGGVYWINPTLKTVSTCPIGGCVGAPRLLAREQAGLKAIATDKSFVYWLTDNAIFKVAK